MNFQDSMKNYFSGVLGKRGPFAELAAEYYERKAAGTIPSDPVSIDSVTGLQSELDDIKDRLQALETAE